MPLKYELINSKTYLYFHFRCNYFMVLCQVTMQFMMLQFVLTKTKNIQEGINNFLSEIILL